jgi:TonB-dependent receptor
MKGCYFETMPLPRNTWPALFAFATSLLAQGFAGSGQQANPPSDETPVVKLERYVVQEDAAAASDAFGDKKLAESLAERVSEAALARGTAENTTDLLKGAAGVTVSSDGDGGSKLAIRGLDARFNRLVVDGQRQSGTRSLDTLPPEIVKSLEVTKALTPDMDADAIGGAINVTTGDAADLKAPYAQGRHQLAMNTSTHRPGWRSGITVGRPFRVFAGRGDTPDAGFLLSANFDDQFRWRENIETNGDWPSLLSPGPAPYANVPVPAYSEARLETTHDESIKQTVMLNADLHAGDHTTLFLRSTYSSDERRRNRARTFFDVAEGTPLALTPESGLFSGVPLQQRNTLGERKRELLTIGVGGKHVTGRRRWEGHVGYAQSTETEPTADAAFASDHLFRIGYDARRDPYRLTISLVDEAAPNDPSARMDPALYHFNQLVQARVDGREQEWSARLDLTWNLEEAPRPSFLKFGGKLQRRERSTQASLLHYKPGRAALSLAGLVGQGAVNLRSGEYLVGPTPDAAAVVARAAAGSSAFSFAADESIESSAGGTYASTESVASGYGMGRVKFGHWTWLGGVRVEMTKFTATGHELLRAGDGAPLSISPAQAAGDYLHVLPGLHLRYEPRADLLVRASLTRTLVRPDYREVAPRQSINVIDRRISSGNPALRPYEATNFDLSLDWYAERFGLFSIAPFHKSIAHFIAETKRLTSLGDRGLFTESRSVNGDTAEVWGLETGWQSATRPIPVLGANANVGLNYTLAHAVTRWPDRAGDALPLPGQARHQGGLTLQASRGRFSAEVALRWHTDVLEDLVGLGRDIYVEGGVGTEVNLAWKLRKAGKFTIGVTNPFRQPIRIYSGDRQHQKEFERAIAMLTVGIQWKK